MTSLPLTFTGERFTPETPGEIAYEHWHRYVFSARFAQGKRVLDAACGEGYGSRLLADVAASVVGIDIDAMAVRHAANRYGKPGSLSFVQASCTALPLRDASVDLIVSFETLEHLREQEAMLIEFRRVLDPHGLIVVSSPNRPIYTEARNYHNEHHVKELDRAELTELLLPFFPQTKWYGQRLLFNSLIWPERTRAASIEMPQMHEGRYHEAEQPADPMYFLVVAGSSSASIPDARSLSLFSDREQTIYREFERTVRAERTLYAMLQEKEGVIAEQHAAASAQLALLQKDIALFRGDLSAHAERLNAVSLELTRLKQELFEARGESADLRARLRYRESFAGWIRFPFGRIKRKLSEGLR